ncbi:heat stress transcription factor A-5 [Tanacetum coccineum]
MEPSLTTTGGGPTPFLVKTYEMVDDKTTDEIVSWSTRENSFVVWDPPEFSRNCFANLKEEESELDEDQNVSCPVNADGKDKEKKDDTTVVNEEEKSQTQGSLWEKFKASKEASSSKFTSLDDDDSDDDEEVYMPDGIHGGGFMDGLEDDLDCYDGYGTRGFRKIDPEKWEFANEGFLKDKKHLLKNFHRRKPVHSHSTPQTSTVDPETAAFEEEIDKLKREKTSLEKNHTNSNNPLQNFNWKTLLNVNHNDGVVDNHSPQSPSRPDFGNFSHHEFSGKLRLELSPAVSDINFVSNSTQSSYEDGGSPQFRSSEGCTRTTEATPGRLLELSDTCTSFGFNMGSSLTHKTDPTLDTNEETEGHPSCQLNLTLASNVSQINLCQDTDTIPQSFEVIRKPPSENVPSNPKPTNNAAPAAPRAVTTRVNDVF